MTFPHWEYFIALEADLFRATRFVDFSSDHYNVYSIEFTHTLLAASSEVEVVIRSLCNELNSSKIHGYIGEYKGTILSKLPIMLDVEVRVPRYGLSFHPWLAWKKGQNLDWWDSYSKVKHNRSTYYKSANLENALKALSGLFVLVLNIYKEHSKLLPLPQLLSCPRYPLPPKKSILEELQDLAV